MNFVVVGIFEELLYAKRMNKALIGTDRLDLLETFVRIVEAGSLSAAAQQQGTTQPTVSRRLQQLERLMGLRLLQRSTHVMKLTEDGERCYAHAKELLERWNAIEVDLRGTQDAPRGHLRVMVPSVFGQQQMIPPVVDFLNKHPDVSVEWLLHDRMPDFIAEGIDCAVHVGMIETPGVVAIRMAELPRIVVAAPGLWGDGPIPNAPDGLSRLPWLALNTFYRSEVVLHHAASGEIQKFSIQPRLFTDHLHALCNAALAGLGVGIASSWAVADAIAQGRLVQLAPQWTASPLPISLVYPPARFHPARLRAFIQVMRDFLPTVPGVCPPSLLSR